MAKKIALATSSEIVEDLELERVNVFTSDIEDALIFQFSEVQEEKINLESLLRVKIQIEETGEEYFPF